MPWWIWITLGLALMAAELLLIDAAFYLFFIGISAVIAGVVVGAGIDMPLWGEIVLFSALCLVTMVLFREKLYQKLRGNLPGYDNPGSGAQVPVREAVLPNARTRVEFNGVDWDALNIGQTTIEAGSAALVVKTDGNTLHIQAN